MEGPGLVGYGDGELIGRRRRSTGDCSVPRAILPVFVRRPTGPSSVSRAQPGRGVRSASASRQSTPALAAFADGYGFAFDDYQREACAHVEAGSGVLVAAPTGAGKTIVGEFAVFLALEQGRKCFYTTPIKALSNQKYADLVRRHGADQVGLLTGDSSDQLRGAGGGDDHRGAAQHDLRRLGDPGQPRLRGDGRGALPGRPVPRGGLGGGDHRARRVDPGGRAVGDGEQRRGVRRLAVRGARRDGRGRLRAAAGAAVPARAGRHAAVRPVRRRGADRARGARRARATSTRRWSRSPGRSPGSSGTTRAGRGARRPGPAHRRATAAARTAGRAPVPRRRLSADGPARCVRAEPARHRRAAGRGGAAAGDRLHLLPGRLRWRRPPAARRPASG